TTDSPGGTVASCAVTARSPCGARKRNRVRCHCGSSHTARLRLKKGGFLFLRRNRRWIARGSLLMVDIKRCHAPRHLWSTGRTRGNSIERLRPSVLGQEPST
ncbi:unnamed protein product, partial [Ectocarpus sp. 12 AP-2014]